MQGDGEDGVAGARLETVFDGPASWWTQGVDEKLHIVLNRAIAYGAGRYSHVLFPENATEVSLELASRLLKGVGKGWASRVFYSDNGSTAVEVAIKMALRKYMHDHKLASLPEQDLSKLEFSVLGLNGSYHGDTLAAMDVQVSFCTLPPCSSSLFPLPVCLPRALCSSRLGSPHRFSTSHHITPSFAPVEVVDCGEAVEVVGGGGSVEISHVEALSRYLMFSRHSAPRHVMRSPLATPHPM